MSDVVYVTGNQNKADYLAKLLDVPLEHQKLDLDELQLEDSKKLVEHKVRQAFELVGAPVLVEDISLQFEALGGLPGPFVKFFVEKDDGLEHMCRMLDGFENRKARGSCTFGFFDGKEVKFFIGAINGFIADHPRGTAGFGWDQIFCPEGFGGKTRAELNEEQYGIVYKTIKPIEALRKFLIEREAKQ